MLADLPDWMDAQFLKTSSGAIVVAMVLLAIVLLFIIRSIVFKVIAIALIAVGIFTLAHYRQTLADCEKRGCECKLFGQTVVGDNCSIDTNKQPAAGKNQ